MCPRLDHAVAELTQQEAGDLPPLAAARLRRHLADCPDCAAEAARVRALFLTARSEADAVVSDALRSRVEAGFAGAAAISEPRLPTQRRFAIGAAAMATGAATLAAMFLMPGTPVQPAVAFARVEAALLSVKSASWTEKVIAYEPLTGSPIVRGAVVWVSVAPPRIHRKSLPSTVGRLSGTDSLATPTLTVRRGGHDLFAVDVWAQPRAMGGTRALLQRAILFPREDDPMSPQSTPPSAGAVTSAWRSDRTVRGGKPLLRFRRTVERQAKGRNTSWKETVLVEPASYRIVRREVLVVDPNTGEPCWRVISDGYRYNQPAPNALKDLLPPVGKQVRLTYRHFNQRTEQERLTRTQALIDRAGDAWRRRDRKAWEAVTDFDLYDRRHYPANAAKPGARRSEYFNAKFESRVPYEGWRSDDVSLSGRGVPPYPYTRRSADAPFPPKNLPKEFEVTAALSVIPPGGGKPQPRTANFLLDEAQDGSLKIIHIDFAPILGGSLRSTSPSGTATRPADRR